MIWRALPALLILSACSQEPTPAAQETGHTESSHPIAVLSCAINGVPLGVSACFISGRNGASGSLKVTSGGTVKQYTTMDYARENGPSWEIPLSEPFEITAQAGGDSGYVLRIIIRDGLTTVFQDEATEFGVIIADSAAIK